MSADESCRIFQPLKLAGNHWNRWALSVTLHGAAVAFLFSLSSPPNQVEPGRIFSLSLQDPVPFHPPQPKPKIHVQPPVPVQVEARRSVLLPPPPIRHPKKMELAHLDAPAIEAPALKNPAITLPNPPAPKLEVFDQAPAPSAPAAPIRSVKVGGFGDVNGVKPAADPRSGQTIAKSGSFDLPPGAGNGGASRPGYGLVADAGFGAMKAAAIPGSGSGHGSIQNAGFGSMEGGTGSGSGPGRGSIQSAGFGNYETASTPQRVSKPSEPSETPVEITFKPKPAYTSEARDKRVEGEVLLEVLFRADGRIDVLRVLRGLGCGLDESARTAASRIRFRPATRAGVPVDSKGAVHIVFELS